MGAYLWVEMAWRDLEDAELAPVKVRLPLTSHRGALCWGAHTLTALLSGQLWRLPGHITATSVLDLVQ